MAVRSSNRDSKFALLCIVLGAQYSDSGNYGCAITNKMDVEEGDEPNIEYKSLVVVR